MGYKLDFTFITNVPQDINLLEKVEALRQICPIKRNWFYAIAELLLTVPKAVKYPYRIAGTTLGNLFQPRSMNNKYRYFFAIRGKNTLILPYQYFATEIVYSDKKELIGWFQQCFPDSEIFSIYLQENVGGVIYLYLKKGQELRYFSIADLEMEVLGEISSYESEFLKDYEPVSGDDLFFHQKTIPPADRDEDNAILLDSIYESFVLNLMTKFGINMEDPAIEQLPVEVYVY